MAMKVRIKINAHEVGRLLKGEGPYQGVRDDLKRRMDRVKARAEANPDLGKATVEEREWVGFDRARYTLGIPGGLEAEHGILARALGGDEGRVRYTTKAGKTRWASQAQVDAWTRGRR